MSTVDLLNFIGGIVLLVLGVVIVVVVLLQEPKDKGMGAITGGSSDSYFGKNKPKTRDSMLAKMTKIFTVAFFVMLLAISFIPLIVNNITG